jgi:hypothetical protein
MYPSPRNKNVTKITLYHISDSESSRILWLIYEVTDCESLSLFLSSFLETKENRLFEVTNARNR